MKIQVFLVTGDIHLKINLTVLLLLLGLDFDRGEREK